MLESWTREEQHPAEPSRLSLRLLLARSLELAERPQDHPIVSLNLLTYLHLANCMTYRDDQRRLSVRANSQNAAGHTRNRLNGILTSALLQGSMSRQVCILL